VLQRYSAANPRPGTPTMVFKQPPVLLALIARLPILTQPMTIAGWNRSRQLLKRVLPSSYARWRLGREAGMGSIDGENHLL